MYHISLNSYHAPEAQFALGIIQHHLCYREYRHIVHLYFLPHLGQTNMSNSYVSTWKSSISWERHLLLTMIVLSQTPSNGYITTWDTSVIFDSIQLIIPRVELVWPGTMTTISCSTPDIDSTFLWSQIVATQTYSRTSSYFCLKMKRS